MSEGPVEVQAICLGRQDLTVIVDFPQTRDQLDSGDTRAASSCSYAGHYDQQLLDVGTESDNCAIRINSLELGNEGQRLGKKDGVRQESDEQGLKGHHVGRFSRQGAGVQTTPQPAMHMFIRRQDHFANGTEFVVFLS